VPEAFSQSLSKFHSDGYADRYAKHHSYSGAKLHNFRRGLPHASPDHLHHPHAHAVGSSRAHGSQRMS
jgi:hypothetical protein